MRKYILYLYILFLSDNDNHKVIRYTSSKYANLILLRDCKKQDRDSRYAAGSPGMIRFCGIITAMPIITA